MTQVFYNDVLCHSDSSVGKKTWYKPEGMWFKRENDLLMYMKMVCKNRKHRKHRKQK